MNGPNNMNAGGGNGMMGNGPRFGPNFNRFMPPNLRNMMPNKFSQNQMRFPGQPGASNFNQNNQMGPPMHQQAAAAAAVAAAASQSGAKWHIPQAAQPQNGFSHSPNSGPVNDSFKIPLKSLETIKQNLLANGQICITPTTNNSVTANTNGSPANNGNSISVTSTNPKTPSPSTNENSQNYADSIDRTCEESVNDLMATIAKLDSNGVQVLPEGRGKTTSPQVHSSTDMNSAITSVEDKGAAKDDPNEDWCAVCMDGGELMCCDKCPKVFHQNCHIPVISSLPDESETWQCLLCYNFSDMPAETIGEKRAIGLSAYEMKILQRIVLELFCQYEWSMPFRQLEPDTNQSYYDVVRNPISLATIRDRLDQANPERYLDVSSFIVDIKKLFTNAYLFYQEHSKIYQCAKSLEKFFQQQLTKWLPKYRDTERFSDEIILNPLKRMRTMVVE